MSCTNGPEPDTANVCTESEDFPGTSHQIPHFCSYTIGGQNLAIGDKYRREYCGRLGSAGEWEYSSIPLLQPCGVNPDTNVTGATPTALCTVPGGGVICERQQYNGDVYKCCLNDYNCNQERSNCFTGADNKNTCAPANRSIVSNDCQENLLLYCSGTTPDDPKPNTTGSIEWFNRWTNPGPDQSCLYAVLRNTYNTIPNDCQLPNPIPPNAPKNAEGYFWSQSLLNAVIANYTANGYILGSLPGTSTYHPFQDYLYENVCLPFPGLCQNGLRNTCAIYDAQRISFNPSLANWCGCYLPAEEYQSYSVKYNISPQCTPTCNRLGTIPIVGINGDPVLCEQDICLIDNISLNIVNSQIQGGIDIAQVCGNCGPQNNNGVSGQCSCVIDNNNVDIINSVIGGNLSLSENCGTITCNQSNPSGVGPNVINVPCSAGNGYNPFTQFEAESAAAEKKADTISVIWTLIIFVLALIIIYIIFRLLAPR